VQSVHQSQPKCPKTLRCSFGTRSRNQIEILTSILKKIDLETLDPDLHQKEYITPFINYLYPTIEGQWKLNRNKVQIKEGLGEVKGKKIIFLKFTGYRILREMKDRN